VAIGVTFRRLKPFASWHHGARPQGVVGLLLLTLERVFWHEVIDPLRRAVGQTDEQARCGAFLAY
jgi:hypothetical protein